MKKQTRILIFAAAIVLLLGIAAGIVLSILPEGEGKTKKTYIINEYSEPAFFVSVIYPDSVEDGYRYAIVKNREDHEDGTATFTYLFQDAGKYMDFAYSQNLMADAFERLLKLEADTVVYETYEDLAEFGLDDESAYKVTVSSYRYLDDEVTPYEIVLLIGKRNPVTQTYYAKRADQPTIYTISSLNASTYLSGPTRYRSADILPVLGTYYDNLKTVTLKTADGQNIVIERIGDFDSTGETDVLFTAFRMLEPYQVYVSDDYLADNFLDVIANLNMMGVAEDFPEDLALYGLDAESRTSVTFETLTETFTLHFGQAQDGGYVYIQKDDIDSVYIAYTAELPFRNADPLLMRSTLVWLHDIQNIEKLDIYIGNTHHVLLVTDNTQKESGTFFASFDGRSIDENSARTLYRTMLGIAYDERLVDGVEENEPSYAFRVTYRSGVTDYVSYYRSTTRQYAVCFGEGVRPDASTIFCVNVANLRTIAEYVEQLENGQILK